MKRIYGKILYENQWVKVMNKQWNRFYAGCLPCSVCGGQKVETVWFNIVTTEVRCRRCFTPAGVAPFVPRVRARARRGSKKPIMNNQIRSAVLAVVLKQRLYPEGVGSFRVASRMRMETADARVVLEKATALGLLTEPTPGHYLCAIEKEEIFDQLAALPRRGEYQEGSSVPGKSQPPNHRSELP